MTVGKSHRGFSNNFVLAVILLAVLIDALLIAHLRARFVADRGYDLRPRHPAVAKPAPP